ncbi:ragulator complex protein LAMTOR1-like [Dromiciops gliroides]|uniref:ragulator complex protein LAMTOR1-like n=1 Tax=Dromiciops gliroides TaxID=33562 RepID=UPI001CC6B94C|nr:ragulator complex protein LAMTOR1-like [Dromiciops gliroides]
MGSCCCSCEDEEAPAGEERARLLEPPGEQDGSSTSDSQSCPDEQSFLASILAEVSSSIIDVAAAQSQRLGPHECMDRARLYHSRLAKLNWAVVCGGGSCCGSGTSCGGGSSGGGLRSYWKKKGPPATPLPSFTNHPHRVLAGALVPYADVQQAMLIAADAHRAMQHVRVLPQEEFVVQFEVV